MSALALCEGAAKSPCLSECSGSRIVAASRVRRGAISCRREKPGTFCLLRTSSNFHRNSRFVRMAETTSYRDKMVKVLCVSGYSDPKHEISATSLNALKIRRNVSHSLCSRQMQWAIKTMSEDTSDQSGNNNRLFSAIQSFWDKFSAKLKRARRWLPMKILFFLIGFYCATAFATVIGQTGDWDILSAGLAVAIVEGIGALMYRASFAFLGRIRNMITMINYWKAGLTLGLFLDSFKYEVDELLESCNPFNLVVNIFTGLW
ncbi:hypothetical protein HU200_009559 [Digitaria exilis]|uniref:Ycf20-like protein n=1 Tax=Digitaria exilis TaxID=1010633 RepID=A0A835FLT6_9POAL|nr:hypothetical protein HU200_009559 [Digitaria exilis]